LITDANDGGNDEETKKNKEKEDRKWEDIKKK